MEGGGGGGEVKVGKLHSILYYVSGCCRLSVRLPLMSWVATFIVRHGGCRWYTGLCR
jgi:hypothetical protein